ncbi:hypothetical protein K377_00692 [Streptomyces sp. PsTaAH-137]|nr:hypothetical protein K377_00692 [Streptomyces sp. PsTaAH-137]
MYDGRAYPCASSRKANATTSHPSTVESGTTHKGVPGIRLWERTVPCPSTRSAGLFRVRVAPPGEALTWERTVVAVP